MTYSLFDSFFDWPTSRFSPPVDIIEDEDRYMVQMDVPGVKEEDLGIELRDNLLTVRGHRQFDSGTMPNGLKRAERIGGTFQRTLHLPRGVGEVEADLDHGVLTLYINKPEEAKPRRIEIGAGNKQLVEGG